MGGAGERCREISRGVGEIRKDVRGVEKCGRVYGVSGEGCGRVYGERKCVGVWGKDVVRGMGEV